MFDRSRAAWEQPGYTIGEHTNSRELRWHDVTRIVIHYTADKRANRDTAQYLRNMQRSYVDNRGYSLGYSVAVDQDGLTWEIRGVDFMPAANVGYNDQTFVILALVDWQNPCNELMVPRIQQLVAWARQQAGKPLPVVGHRDIAPTRCPGDGIYQQIQNHVFDPQPSKDYDVKIVDPPQRVYDSRKQGGRFADGETRKIAVGHKGAVFVNLTVVAASQDGYVTAWGNGPMPDVSNVNYSHGQTIANTSWVPVAPDGTVQVYTYRSCDVLIDVQATV